MQPGAPPTSGQDGEETLADSLCKREGQREWESHNRKPRTGIERPHHCLCGPSFQPLSPLCLVGPMEGCGAAAVGLSGMPQPFLGGTRRGGWSRCCRRVGLGGGMFVQGLRKEWVNLGGCVGLVLTGWGALMAVCPRVWGSKMPAGIWLELASLLRSGSWTAMSLLCLHMGVLGEEGPRFS